MKIHAYHVYDEANIKSQKDILDVLTSCNDEILGFINDFDVPYVNVRSKYPRLKKKKRKMIKDNEDGSDESDD